MSGVPSQAADALDLLTEGAFAACTDTEEEALVRGRAREVRMALIEPYDAAHMLSWFEEHKLLALVSASTVTRLRRIAGVE